MLLNKLLSSKLWIIKTNVLKLDILNSLRNEFHFILPDVYVQHCTYPTISINYVGKQFCLWYSTSTISNEIHDSTNKIMKQNSDAAPIKRDELDRIMNLFLARGYTTDEIKEKVLSHFDPMSSSYLKFKLLAEIKPDMLTLLPLLSLTLPALRLAVKRVREDEVLIKDFADRISYLSHHLELHPDDLIKLLSKHSSLLTMNFSRLDCKMKILKSANISAEYIVKDPWIFNYNETLLADRIKAATSSGLLIKPWLLRCPKEIFHSMLKKWEETQQILNGEDEVSYLARKLDCSKEYVGYMMDKNRLLKTINIPKLEKVINFLYGKGYTPEEVRLFPRVFCSSVNTLNDRFTKFHDAKGGMPTMSQLCFSAKKYQSILH